MRIKDILTIFEILAVPTNTAKVGVKKRDTTVAHVVELRAQTGIVAVHRILHLDAIVNIHGVFLVTHVKAVEGIARVKDVIAHGVFIVKTMHGDMRQRLLKFRKLFRRLIQPLVNPFQLPYFFKIFFFRVGLIEKMILLIAEIHASKAILAALAVIAKVTIGAVSTVAAEIAAIAFLDVHAFVAQFGFFRKSAVYTIAAKSNPKAIVTVF